jgi:hypothetical protein
VSKFAVLDASGLLDPSSTGTIVKACHRQLREHLAPAWNRATLPSVREVQGEEWIEKDEVAVYLLGSPGDRAGVFGEHFEREGRAVCRVYVKPILDACPGRILWAPNSGTSVASVVSHELLEAEIDTDADTWLPTPEGDYVALEVCDPDSGTAYDLTLQPGLTVGVANFAHPAFFERTNAWKGQKLDHLGRLTEPFQPAPGGYVIRRLNGASSLVFGSRPPPSWFLGLKFQSESRPVKRLAR